MLERTAGCLESGSLRRLLPASKKSLKSCRTLHSTFWSHAAGDLELSPLWAALVRATEPADQHQEAQQKSSTGHSAMLLDFLYPTGTINFLRQYSGWCIDRSDGRLVRSGFGKLGYRQYTSSAKYVANTDSITGGEVAEKGQESEIEDVDMGLLYSIMGLTKSYDYEEAWRQYSLLSGVDQRTFRKPLMEYISKSDRIIDAERITELFEMLEKEQRSASTYQQTIRAYLKLRNLADAMQLYQTALDTLKSPAGAAELLAHFVQNSSWSRALSFWKDYQESRERALLYSSRMNEAASTPWRLEHDLYGTMNALPYLGTQAIALSEYVNRRIENSSPDDLDIPRLIEFATKIIRGALKNTDNFSPSRYFSLLEYLHAWKVKDSVLYDEAIQTLLSLQQGKLAVKCYRRARQMEGLKLSRPTLHAILKHLCDHHSILGMKQVLDDFFKLYSRPSRFAYKLCMKEFASQGDAKTVHALFDQFTTRFSRNSTSSVTNALLSADEIAPLLQVHAMRGEVSQVVSIFNQIGPIYGLQPTLLCWNILLSAYGKVHDFDAAYTCFEALLDSPHLFPDDYTFGTILGICASRGDLERVLEVYVLAEEAKIVKSAAMVDALVLAYIKDEDLQQAEKVCEDALSMKLEGSRTRMWNLLLVAYAMRRELSNVNRLLQRMSEANIDYDQYTYSALMQALCMVRQPDRAYAILTQVMPEAGVRATAFHYAVVMGGYIGVRATERVFWVHNRMRRRNVMKTVSSDIMHLKGTVQEEKMLLMEGSDEEVFGRARQMFQNVVSSFDNQDISQAPRKGVGPLPLDIASTTTFYSYIMFVLGQAGKFQDVDKLYEEYKRTIPENRKDSPPPIQVLSALMTSKLKEEDHQAVQECWDIIWSEALKQGRTHPLPDQVTGKRLSVNKSDDNASHDLEFDSRSGNALSANFPPNDLNEQILTAHNQDLSGSLVHYLKSLSDQGKVDEMAKTVNMVLAAGFVLDNHTWNRYVQLLTKMHQYKAAFQICEDRLMNGWTGWAKIRWQLPVRNRLPINLRRQRQWRTHLRPVYHTLLYLARGFIELGAMAAESRGSQMLLLDLERDCPRVLKAIKTMQRSDDDVERHTLRGSSF